VNKIQSENNKRLDILFRKSHGWLSAVAFNLAKDKEVADELVGELYLYLAEKCNPALWYLDSFNLMYAHAFLNSRFLNRIKAAKRNVPLSDSYDEVESEYDVDADTNVEDVYNKMVDELKRLERTKLWAPSKIYQMYAFDKEMTFEKLASELKLSKSTVYLNCKKIKKHLKDNLDNPFK
jgi:DNA-directed RNA polymerase specialized sigma24 family protein